ncbi:MAG: hypothetical protein RL380_1273 [Verrucomicrobiota bacterium]
MRDGAKTVGDASAVGNILRRMKHSFFTTADRPPQSRLARWLGALRQARKLKLFTATGVEPHSQLPLTILGGGQRQKNYLFRRAFQPPIRETPRGQQKLTDLFQSTAALASECSLIIVECARPETSAPPGWFFLPGWVTGEVALPLPERVAKSEKVKSDLRRIRRLQYEFVITHGAKAHREYYRTMHLPLVRQSHGDTASFDPLAEIRPHFTRHELLLVRKKAAPTAALGGAMILYERGVPRLQTFGIREGDPALAHDGTLCALYHFSFQHLTDQGCTRAHTGRARPFLRDGVLRYKRKWGNTLTGSFWHWYSPGFALKILAYTPATKAVLAHNPFIFETSGQLHGAVFTEAARPLARDLVTQLVKDFFYPGLARLVIHCFQPRDARRPDELPPELADRVVIRDADELLASKTSPAD